MIEDVVDRVGLERRIQGDADVPGHPNRQVCEDEVRAVLRDDRDVAARLEVERLQVSRHPPDLIHALGPGVGLDLSVADRLRHPQLVRRGLFPPIGVV